MHAFYGAMIYVEDEREKMTLSDAIEKEAQAQKELCRLAHELAKVVRPIWHHGDGYGGHVWLTLKEIFAEHGLNGDNSKRSGIHRKKISRRTLLQVFKRDGHRCVRCGSEENLEPDHIVPLARGGSDAIQNLQILCRTCNLKKGAK